jgi:soluble lytic murein transglycosylase-like protein
MRRLLGLFMLLGLLYGCSDAGYLPYAPHALDPAQLQSLVSTASERNNVSAALLNAVVMAESAGNPSAISTEWA